MLKDANWKVVTIAVGCWIGCFAALQLAHAESAVISQCIGDVGPGKCASDSNYDCEFARANSTNTDRAAAELTCAKTGASVVSVTRLNSHEGGNCGYIVDTVTCSNWSDPQ
jgi:hypothetical protein